MRFFPCLLASIVVTAGTFAADPAAVPPPVVVTSTGQGSTIELKRGQFLNIVLDANRTTGFSWTMKVVRGNVLSAVGEPIYATTPAKTGRVGVGGTETWQFRAVATGRQLLQFLYRRPFEKNKPPARTLNFKVRVNS